MDDYIINEIKNAKAVSANMLILSNTIALQQQQINILNTRIEILEELINRIGGIINEESIINNSNGDVSD